MSLPWNKLLAAALFPCVASGVLAAPGPCGVAPVRPRCEYRVDPLGIDSPHPRLGWILQPVDTAARDLAQSAYEVIAASSPSLLAAGRGDLWDSGKVASDQMNLIPYGGKPLASSEQVWWKVKVWDQAGVESAWSPAAQWTMGVLTGADWSGAKWIAAPDANQPNNGSGPKSTYETVLLRREFTVRPGLRRALAHVCGLGQYEMTLSGTKVSADLLTPGWTWYSKTCLYNTYDITPALTTGTNAAGLFLGNGFYNIHKGRYTKTTGSFGPVQAIALIRLEYSDGSVENVVTDERGRPPRGRSLFPRSTEGRITTRGLCSRGGTSRALPMPDGPRPPSPMVPAARSRGSPRPGRRSAHSMSCWPLPESGPRTGCPGRIHRL